MTTPQTILSPIRARVNLICEPAGRATGEMEVSGRTEVRGTDGGDGMGRAARANGSGRPRDRQPVA